MKPLIGVILMFGSIVLGLYLGVWVLLVGGLIGIIDAIKATPTDGWGLFWGAIKMLVAGPVGWIAFMVMFFSGLAMVTGKTVDQVIPGRKARFKK